MSISGEHHTQLNNNNVQKQESLLTNSFDDQIKLVEDSIATLKSDTAKERKKNKTSNKNTLQGAYSSQKQNGKNVYTNRSRIYRFNSKEQVSIVPPTNVDITMEPPKDEADARASMLMSWYMAGYRTGYYEAMKRCNQDFDMV